MAYIYDIADTWNASGTTFTAIKMNVTDTSSAADSMLMDLQVGGVSKFNVRKGGLASLSALNFPRQTGGEYIALSNEFFVGAGVGVVIGKNWPSIGWADISGSSLSNVDLSIIRDAANTLAQRRGVNAQTSRLYGTYTDASNYRRLTKTMSTGGVAEIKPEGAGTGASGNVLHISGLPTSNPGAGILWNNAGSVVVGT